jgi:uncharacterized protein (TIGR04222 family)
VAVVVAMAQPDLSPAQAGYLNRGQHRALTAALVVLRRSSSISVVKRGALKRRRTPPGDPDTLTRAIYESLETPIATRIIRHEAPVRAALTATRKELEAAKLLVPTWRRRLVPIVLVAAAAALFVWLPAAAWPVAALAVVSLFQWRTRAGRRVLRELAYAYPIPDEETKLPPRESGMVVALHGVLNLPCITRFARAAELLERRSPPRAGADTPSGHWGYYGAMSGHGNP